MDAAAASAPFLATRTFKHYQEIIVVSLLDNFPRVTKEMISRRLFPIVFFEPDSLIESGFIMPGRRVGY